MSPSSDETDSARLIAMDESMVMMVNNAVAAESLVISRLV
jgi:hypothetical protein